MTITQMMVFSAVRNYALDVEADRQAGVPQAEAVWTAYNAVREDDTNDEKWSRLADAMQLWKDFKGVK